MEKFGITNQQFANYTGLSFRSVQEIRNNRNKSVTLHTVEKICDGLNCSFNDLFYKAYYIKFTERCMAMNKATNPLFNEKHFFEENNNKILEGLFKKIGINVFASPYNHLKSSSLRTDEECHGIRLNCTLRIQLEDDKTILYIDDNHLKVNNNYYSHENVSRAIVDTLEKFAKNIDIDHIIFRYPEYLGKNNDYYCEKGFLSVPHLLARAYNWINEEDFYYSPFIYKDLRKVTI